jgi:DGQHR domain-containing protein
MPPKPSKTKLRRRALLLQQTPEHPLYLLSLTGEELLQIADISRVSRDDTGTLIGYQRPEVKRHVQEITEYLDGEDVLFPNSIILALSSRVHFTRSRGPQVDDGVVAAGVLEIPLPRNGESRPAWIVDGQQRALALARSHRRNLAIPVNAFIADDVASQRDQFIRVNNTKPLPRGLLTELLPEVGGPLPSKLAARRIPSAITEQLNIQPTSPFHGLIRRASGGAADKSKAVITDASVVRMIEESLSTPSGCLFPYRNIATGETDTDTIWQLLTIYWQGVKEAFPEAWAKPPAKSRLMHGVGIRSMGRLMDKIMPIVDLHQDDAVELVQRELAVIEPVCHWTSGRWEELGDLQWNELQNVPRHIRTLSNLLIRTYVQGKSAKNEVLLPG